MSLDLGRLLKFRPSKTENLEEAEGKSPSLFVDFQVRVVNTGFKPNRKKARQDKKNKVNHFYFQTDINWFTV